MDKKYVLKDLTDLILMKNIILVKILQKRNIITENILKNQKIKQIQILYWNYQKIVL